MKRSLCLVLLVLWLAVEVHAQAFIGGPRTIQGWLNPCTTTGSSNTYACTLPYPLPVAGYANPQCFLMKPNHTNTGAATLNVDGRGARAIRKWVGSSLVDVSAADIVINRFMDVCYDGTVMQIKGAPGSGGGGGGSGDVVSIETTSINGQLTVFDATTGKNIRAYEGGVGLLKTDANNVVSPAVAGTDYVTPAGLTSGLAGKQDTVTWGAGLTATGATASVLSTEAGFLVDGGGTGLTCGAGQAGKMQTVDTGVLQYCGGEPTPALWSGFLTQSGLSWNVTASTCTGDGNAGKLTVNASNQIVCAADLGGAGGSGTMTQVNTAAPITGGPITTSGTIGIADAAADGTTKGAVTFVAADFNCTAGLCSIDYANAQAASASVKGFLTTTDWNTFNAKVSTAAGSSSNAQLTVFSGTSGATITTYGGGAGMVRTNAAGVPSAAVAGTDYQAPITWGSGLSFSGGTASLDVAGGPSASGSVKGFLTAADWTTFNAKVGTAVGSSTVNQMVLFSNTTGNSITTYGGGAGIVKTSASGVPSAAVAGTDYQAPITWGVGLTATGNNANVISTEAGFLVNGSGGSLTCGAGTGGRTQIGPGHNLEYCGYEATPLLHIAGLPSGLAWDITQANCTTDENGGKLTIVDGEIVCAPDSVDPSAVNWPDGNVTSLTCGGGAQGLHQVMDSGRLEYCGGEDVSTLYTGYLLPSPFTFNLVGSTCTGDANGGKLTINGANQVVCSADQGGGAGGSGDITSVGNIASGDAGTTGFPFTSLWFSGIAAPAAPTSGQGRVYLDQTAKNLCVVADNGARKCGVQGTTAVPNQFVTSISTDGAVGTARPSSSDLSDAATLVKLTDQQIVTNKQIVPRSCELGATSGNVTPNADSCEYVYRYDVSGTINVQTPTTTGANPRQQHPLTFDLFAAAQQTITWSVAYAAGHSVPLPTTIPASKYVAMHFRYNPHSTKWDIWSVHVGDVPVSKVLFTGTTDGIVTMQPQASAGTYNFNLPTTAGSSGQVLTSAGGGTSAMTWTTLTAGATATSSTVGQVLRVGSGPTIAYGALDLADTDAITNDLPYANLTPSGAASRLLGRGSAAGAGDWQEITLGTGLSMSGTTLNASGGTGGTGTVQLHPLAIKLPASNAATPDGSTNTSRVRFDSATSECAIWEFQVPADYNGSPVLKWTYSSAVNTGGVAIEASLWDVAAGDGSLIDSENYAAVNTCTDAAVPGTAGHLDLISCTLTNTDGLTAGHIGHLKVCRAVANAADTAAGDMDARMPALWYSR